MEGRTPKTYAAITMNANLDAVSKILAVVLKIAFRDALRILIVLHQELMGEADVVMIGSARRIISAEV